MKDLTQPESPAEVQPPDVAQHDARGARSTANGTTREPRKRKEKRKKRRSKAKAPPPTPPEEPTPATETEPKTQTPSKKEKPSEVSFDDLKDPFS
jgi:sRNA-binding protein